jgi:hypothetical protein
MKNISLLRFNEEYEHSSAKTGLRQHPKKEGEKTPLCVKTNLGETSSLVPSFFPACCFHPDFFFKLIPIFDRTAKQPSNPS